MLKPAAAWPFPAKGKEEVAAQLKSSADRLAQLEEIERSYNWLMDCARKTGITVKFQGDTMIVGHGIESVVDDLLNSCKAVDADIELTGRVSRESIEMVRASISTVVTA